MQQDRAFLFVQRKAALQYHKAMHYTKLPISPAAAVQRLMLKGLAIPDPAEAEKLVRFVSYFRLRGYCLPFMQTAPAGHAHGTRIFTAGTTWAHIVQAYECDRFLRSAISGQLERIEVAFRSVIVDHMAQKYGACFYSDVALGFASKAIDHMDWLVDCMKEIKRSGEHPIKRYFKTYTKPAVPPSWYVTEAITFTKWSLLFKILPNDKGAIANMFRIPPDTLDSWMHALAVLRNMCAHHSRLLDKKLTLQPATLRKQRAEFAQPTSTYAHLAVIRMLTSVIDGNDELKDALQALPARFPLIDVERFYAIPPDWHLREIWR